MKNRFSIVVVCKDEAEIIEKFLRNVSGLGDEVIVYDNGSSDGTQQIIRSFPVTLVEGDWLGYGRTKQKAVGLAGNDWILFLDADELPDETLKNSIRRLDLSDTNTVYDMQRVNFLGRKKLKWGEWGGDHQLRLFNRNWVNWDDAPVHETLLLPKGTAIRRLDGALLHYSMKDTADYSSRMVKYALLNAEKYFSQGRRSSWLKRNISPCAGFIKHYFFQLGFLDGWEGYITAKMTAYYTFLKYARLQELWNRQRPV